VEKMPKQKLRNALYSGSFYPSEKKVLSKTIDDFIKTPNKKLNGTLKALIVPHAGYIYSGKVAGFGFNLIKKAKPKNIILFGPSHKDFIIGVKGFNGKWVTPLGKVIVSNPGLAIIENDSEHSLEVQVPFLQRCLKKFVFTPIIYGEINPKNLENIIEKYNKKDSVLIASSDFSHYLPYNFAKKVDSESIDSVLKLDFNRFVKEGDACGKPGIAALIVLAKKYGWKPLLLEYKNSGDVSGNKNNVVGYASIAFIGE
jgi:hypothetical protein